MTYISLDIGSKKTGIAISDKTNTIASPLKTIPTRKVVEEVVSLSSDREIEGVVLGDSETIAGEKNEIMSLIGKIEVLLKEKGFSVFYEKEWLSTFEANRITKGDDSNAAAIILQRFLERK